MKTRLWKIIFAILLLPVCANATTMDFYTDGTITDGNIFDIVNIWDIANVTMTGGWVGNLYTYESSITNIDSGTIHFAIQTYDSSVVNLYSVQSDVSPPGPDFTITAFDNSVINIYGYGFQQIPSSFLKGYWITGDEFLIDLRVPGTESHIVLHEIPEPCTLVFLAVASAFMVQRPK
jgi:hypothetical protein